MNRNAPLYLASPLNSRPFRGTQMNPRVCSMIQPTSCRVFQLYISLVTDGTRQILINAESVSQECRTLFNPANFRFVNRHRFSPNGLGYIGSNFNNSSLDYLSQSIGLVQRLPNALSCMYSKATNTGFAAIYNTSNKFKTASSLVP